MDWITVLANALPKLRTRIQLAGFLVLVAAVLIVKVISPNNTKAMLSAGAIGVSLVVFGLVFQVLHLFPERQRIWLVLILFFMFCCFSVAMVVLTASYILQSRPKVDVSLFEGRLPESLAGSAAYREGVREFENVQPAHVLSYNYTRNSDTALISYSMPYMDDYNSGRAVEDTQSSWFAWRKPILSVQLVNPSTNETLEIAELQIRLTEAAESLEPLLMFWSPSVYKGSVSQLAITNLGSGEVLDPVIRYGLRKAYTRIDEHSTEENDEPIEKAHLITKSLTSFDKGIHFDLNLEVPPTLLKDPSTRLVGDLSYSTKTGNQRTIHFSLHLNNEVNGGFFEPSYLYNVRLDAQRPNDTTYRSLSQRIKPGEAEHFLVSIDSQVSARYKFTVVLKASSGLTMESNPVDLNIFEPPQAANSAVLPLQVKADSVPIPVVEVSE
jgi:hypothetical protein